MINPITTPCIRTLTGAAPGICGGRASLATLRKARPLSDSAIAHITGYCISQNAAAQVWTCGVGRDGGTLFVVVPRDDIIRAARSPFASLIWDDETANAAAGRNVETYAPRVLAHGMATAMLALQRCGCKPETYTAGLANVRYADINKGRNNTRSDMLEKMIAEWLQSFQRVEITRWTGALNGGGYDYSRNTGRIASAHYNADVSVRYIGGCTINLEVKGHCGRMICPQSARAEFGL